MESDKKYHVVEFPDERDIHGSAAMDVISSTWVVEEDAQRYTYWPNFRSAKEICRAAQDHMPVVKSWQKIFINIIYTNRDFAKVTKKLRRLESASEVSQSEDDGTNSKRKLIRNKKLVDFETDDYESEGPLPKPPKRDVPKGRNAEPNVLQEVQQSTSNGESDKETRCQGCQINEALLMDMGVKIDVMSSDIKYLIRVTQNRENTISNKDFNPVEPCETSEQLKNLNGELQEARKMDEMVSTLQTIGGKDAADVVRRILGKLITNSLSKQYNWCGRNSKEKFCDLGNIIRLINLVLKKAPYGQCTEKEVDMTIKAWLRNASDREGGRLMRMKKDNIENGT